MRNIPKEVVAREIWRSYAYARDAHHGQFRKSGDPYISHPVASAKLLTILHPDLVSLQSCFLHDVPEDTEKTAEDVEREFGHEVAHIVAGMEKVSKLKYRGEERTIGSLRKMFIAMSEDMRVILVKLADRLHNMQTLDFHPDPEKRKRIALETLNVYAPIADRLGIFDFKEMLETECFRILYPEDCAKITRELADLRIEQETFVTRAKDRIRELIPPHIPAVDISLRVKSPYSIYKKIKRKGYESVRDLYDLFAIRIITDSVQHCYEILGIIHGTWTPVPKRFKDYIALPKENGYQSLHTTVVGMFQEFRKQPTEIQIRTIEMHSQAEIGVAAHFEYSESGASQIAKDVYWVTELKDIIEKSGEDGGEFLDEMKISVFEDRIFVFTPKGAIVNLPRGATPVDFAYSIHSDLGNHLAFARVNDRVVTLDSELRNGDRVEIVTDKLRKPSVTWLSFVKTTRAKEVIKSSLNKEQREDLIEKGRSILNSYLEKHFGKSLDKELSILKNLDGRVLDTKAKEEVLLQVGNLSRRPASVIRSLREEWGLPHPHSEEEIPAHAPKPKAPAEETAELIIGGEKGITYRLAHCCSPKPGDRVVGYSSRLGITIHRVGCQSLRKGTFDRFIPASWGGKERTEMVFKVEMVFENRIGVLRKLTDIFFLMKINILEISQKSENSGKSARILFSLRTEEEDYYLYERLVERIRLGIPEFRESKLIEMK
jgi:GTP pyrophosphokinase